MTPLILYRKCATRGPPFNKVARLAQRQSNSFTPSGSAVQSRHRAPSLFFRQCLTFIDGSVFYPMSKDFVLISIVVPVLNEEKNVPDLIREIADAARFAPITEMIFVDDGSTDGTLSVLKSLKSQYPMLRVLRHHERARQSAAMWTGVRAARHNIVVTMDGDGQNNPADIPNLYAAYQKNIVAHSRLMVAGQRVKRNDTLARRLASKFANNLRGAILRDRTRDTGCSLKMFNRDVYLELPYFNHMHRYLPALMIRAQAHLIHVDVSHRARQSGVSKYTNLNRALVGVLDLFGVWWLLQRPYTYPPISEE